MTAITVEAQTKAMGACLDITRALEKMPDIWLCLMIRLRLPQAIRSLRSINATGEFEGDKHIRELYDACDSMRKICKSLDGKIDRVSWWLLKTPLAELDRLCMDLSLALDPEVRDLVKRIAAAA